MQIAHAEGVRRVRGQQDTVGRGLFGNVEQGAFGAAERLEGGHVLSPTTRSGRTDVRRRARQRRPKAEARWRNAANATKEPSRRGDDRERREDRPDQAEEAHRPARLTRRRARLQQHFAHRIRHAHGLVRALVGIDPDDLAGRTQIVGALREDREIEAQARIADSADADADFDLLVEADRLPCIHDRFDGVEVDAPSPSRRRCNRSRASGKTR